MTVWYRCEWCRRVEAYPPWVSHVRHSHGGVEWFLKAFRTRALARALIAETRKADRKASEAAA